MSAVSTVHVPPHVSMVDRMAVGALSASARLKNEANKLIIRYDGWFLVLLAVLLVLSVVFFAAMTIWCFQQGRFRFTGNWEWGAGYNRVFVECG